ncbi:MAG TPA: Rho termination factor N-terminal domain-containing protein [Solirubrobacteraceae bacterium]|nr:Rho termination factor N-terminal domain-containing protein [Solirubrobacteraceae bacterium]
MAVLERSELEASPLADLHAIADQLGLDGFRRLRKADLIDAILGEDGGSQEPSEGEAPEEPASPRETARPASGRRSSRGGRSSRSRGRAASAAENGGAGEREEAGGKAERDAERPDAQAAVAEGAVEVLGNGSAFLRVSPPDPSDDDVYISAAQVRRCELVSGDRISGPVRTPRRSERYPSLVRIDTINGASADAVSERAPYEELPVAYASERLALGSEDPTLAAIEWLTPLGRGSRAVICGAPRSGKTTTLRKMLAMLAGRDGLDVSVVLAGVRPEEIADWQEGPVPPAAALSFAASADAQGQALERALDAAKRVAVRGADALVLVDGLDGMHPQAARKALAAARNLRDAGSLTLIATASRPFGGETTVIALDAALTATGRQPILDLLGSGTLRAELLVGDDGAEAIAKARAAALEAS